MPDAPTDIHWAQGARHRLIELPPATVSFGGTNFPVGGGYRVEARITLLERDDVLLVPASALFRDVERWAVYVLEDGRARKRFVDVGPRNDRAAIVEKGLSDGDVVIVYPGDDIADGVRARIRALPD